MGDIAVTPLAAPHRHYFLTYFGTFLTGTDRDDWIAHAPLSADTLGWLIFVDIQRPGDQTNALLGKCHEAPRRLPDFRRETIGYDRLALRCIDIRPGEGLVGRFMSASPDGRVEIDREEARDWERYQLLSHVELQWLIAFMEKARPPAGDVQPFKWRFIDGFRISDGRHDYDVARLLRAKVPPNLQAGMRFSLLDDRQELVDVVI